MPELPEVETIARDIRPHLEGRRIVRARVLRPDVLRRTAPAAFVRSLAGRRVTRVGRRAKNLVLDLDDGRRVVIQPGMTGAVLTDRRRPGTRATDPYDVVHLDLETGTRVRYRDVRRLGRIYLFTPGQWARHDAAIGPEPLDPAFTPAVLAAALNGSRQAVKKAIMDQRRLAGVGNIYASEALWMAGIDPSRESRRVSAAEAERLHAAIVAVLAGSIERRGTTVRDYRTGAGTPGGFQGRLAVYERAGEPCLRCGSPIAATHALDARSTYFCYRCQR